MLYWRVTLLLGLCWILQIQLVVSDHVCLVCGDTSFFDTSSRQCVSCRPNSMINQTGLVGSALSVDECLCKPGFEGDENGCTACEAGKFKSNISNTLCISCVEVKPDSGHDILSSTSVDDCKCNAGFSLQEALCVQCVSGKYKDVQFSDNSCNDCLEGSYCPRGSTDPIECFGNSMSEVGAKTKDGCLCNTGYEIQVSSYVCSECPQGKYKDVVSNRDFCEDCTANTYNNLTAQSVCVACPDNSFVSSEGSTQISDCQCNAGYQKNIDESCSECPLNYYRSQDMVDAELDACQQCSFDSYIESMGSTSSSDCITCPVHSSRDNGGSEGFLECTCNAGYTPGTPGCEACGVGKYKSSRSSDLCTDCPLNSNSGEGSASVADCRCNTGYLPESEGSSVCVQCPPGYFCPDGLEKRMCLEDTFSERAGVTECQVCPTNTVYLEKSSHTVQFTKDDDPVSVTLMNCREYENKYEPWLGIGYRQISEDSAFCCQVEVNTISNSGRLCIPWTNQDRGYTDFKISQGNLCRFFGCSSQFTVRPGDPNLVGGGGIYTDEFGDTFNYNTYFGSCISPSDWGYCTIDEYDTTSSECLNWHFERNLLCCNDFDRRQATCTLEPHVENQCMCRAGYELGGVGCIECTDGNYKAEISNTTYCEPCPPNTYTEGTASVECKTCPANSLCTQDCFSRDACICNNGYYKNSSLTPFECDLCPAGSYCASQQKNICPGYRTSLEGAQTIDECFCAPGMFLNSTEHCESCEPGFWCRDDVSNACPTNSGAGYGNAAEEDCKCNAGYWRNCVENWSGFPEYISHVDTEQECTDKGYELVEDSSSFRCGCSEQDALKGPCEECKPDFVCTGDDVLHCPQNSVTGSTGASSLFHCVCSPGYYQANYTRSR